MHSGVIYPRFDKIIVFFISTSEKGDFESRLCAVFITVWWSCWDTKAQINLRNWQESSWQCVGSFCISLDGSQYQKAPHRNCQDLPGRNGATCQVGHVLSSPGKVLLLHTISCYLRTTQTHNAWIHDKTCSMVALLMHAFTMIHTCSWRLE